MNWPTSIVGLLAVAVAVAVAGSDALGAEQRPPVKGTISELNPPGAITIKINVGSRQTVRTRDVFAIYRDKKQIGSLKVTEVGPRNSTATITELRRKFRLRKGDAVLRDVTMQFARRLMPGVVVKAPAELGRKYAAADIKAGVKRILYYGRPWSAGKPLIDEKTGFPVTIATGCTVTKNFVQFVNAYNAAMKKNARKQHAPQRKLDSTDAIGTVTVDVVSSLKGKKKGAVFIRGDTGFCAVHGPVSRVMKPAQARMPPSAAPTWRLSESPQGKS